MSSLKIGIHETAWARLGRIAQDRNCRVEEVLYGLLLDAFRCRFRCTPPIKAARNECRHGKPLRSMQVTIVDPLAYEIRSYARRLGTTPRVLVKECLLARLNPEPSLFEGI